MLEELFAPRTVAVIGASRDPGKVGHAVLANVIAGGFAGEIYPVNPSAAEILGRRCYASIGQVPPPVDLAVIVVPASATIGAMDECGRAGVPVAIVVSAGFRETGPAGADLERRLIETARSHGIRVLGPNCLGVIATRARLNASFAPLMPAPGSISFLSQSGALGTAVLDWAAGQGIGLAHFVSLGNKADITEVDLIEAWREDAGTDVVVAYLEAVANGRGFVEAVSALVRQKPFIGLMAGVSDAGARAVSSHTGSLAGSRVAYEAAFRASGATAAETVEELFDFAEGFSRQPLPAGPRVGIVTNAGGPAILATDACDRYGMTLASLGGETIEALRKSMPAAAALYNPVDVLGDADAARYRGAASIVAVDPGVDSVIAILSPQAMTEASRSARAVTEVAKASGKTFLAAFMGSVSVREAIDVLRQGGIPEFGFPERAVATLAAMTRHRERLAAAPRAPEPVEADRATVRASIEHARDSGRSFITEASAQKIAAAYGIPVPKAGVASDLNAALALAGEIGFPVVMKIASPDILHKSDIGGIALGLDSTDAVRSAYERILSRVSQRMPDARIWGVTIQQQLPPGREVIIGVQRDPTFGPLLMFGLGGIYVEVLGDVVFRLCPVSRTDAHEMMAEIRGAGLLRGARGAAPGDMEAVADAIVRVSALAMDFPEIAELDINPLIVADRGQGAIAADIRIGIGG